MSDCKCPEGYPRERRFAIHGIETAGGYRDWCFPAGVFVERYHVPPCEKQDETLGIETSGLVDLPAQKEDTMSDKAPVEGTSEARPT